MRLLWQNINRTKNRLQMKKYLPIIIFTLNTIYLTVMFLSIFLEAELVRMIYGVILSILFLLFWLYLPMTKKVKKSKNESRTQTK